MQTRFMDLEDERTPETVLTNREEATKLLNSLRNREPFMCELVGDNGYKLGIGISRSVGCVQYSRVDGELPYLMAANGTACEECSFMMTGTLTPVDGEFCLPMEKVIDIAGHFVETGQQHPAIRWQSI